jgi:hypothetical protein
MPRIVTGSFPDFAGAARGISALMAAGFTHGEISVIALPPPEAASPSPAPSGSVRAGASLMGALGAMAGPGTVWALPLPDPAALIVWAPAAGALAGACVGALAAVLLHRWAGRPRPEPPVSPARVDAEAVTVVVDDEARADAVCAILRAHGASFDAPASARRRRARRAALPLRLVPFRS